MKAPGSRPPLTQRVRYLAIFGEHAALAAGLRSLRPVATGQAARPRSLRAVVLSPHPPAHLGTLARFTRWSPHLERLGCHLEILTPSTDSEFDDYTRNVPGADARYHHACIRNTWRNIRHAAHADVVVLHRGLLPFSPWQRPTFEQLLARLNPCLVYDFYDSIWHQRQQVSEQSASRLGGWLHPPDKVEEIIRLARVVTVANQPLAEFATRYHDDVRVIPMLLEPGEYEVRQHKAESPVVIGWLGGRGNLPRLLSIAAALRRVAERRDIVVHVISSERVEIPGVPVRSFTHPWSPQSEREDLAAMDVGLLPLSEGSPEDRYKSPFKLLQYLASGMAVVATPMSIDTARIKPGECFLPARTDDDWVEHLTRVVDDAALRARLGRAGREAIEAHYSFASHAPAFIDALRTAAGTRTTTPLAPLPEYAR